MNTFSNPRAIVEQLDIIGGQHIADLGSGTGHYCMALAEKFKGNSDTKIFAVDVQKDLLSRLESDAEHKGFHAIYTVWGDIEQPLGTRLRDASIDMVIVANTLFQVEHKKGLIDEVKRILKPEGRLAIIDWSESFGNLGPKEDHVITESSAKSLCEESGMVFRKNLSAGEHHYGFIVSKS